MEKYCLVNGQLQLTSEPTIVLNDLGVLRGYAVFDFIRVLNGRPLFWSEHVARFRQSAINLGLELKLADEQLLAQAKQVLEANSCTKGSLRLILTGGPTEDGISPQGQPTLAILNEDYYELPEEAFTEGVRILTTTYERLFASSKTTNYQLAVSKLPERRTAKATELLYLDEDNYVLECSTSNIFICRDRVLATPKGQILAGITRAKVIGLAHDLGLKVEERPIDFAELLKADEVFLTATNKDVLAIVKVDNRKISTGRPGPITKKLLSAYRQLINQEAGL